VDPLNSAYILRQATDADFVFMRETKFDGIQPYVEVVWGWNRQQQEDLFAATCDAAHSQIVVVDGTDVGFIHVIEDAADQLFLAGIYVTAAMRRRGIGSAILRDLIDGSVRQGKALTLRVLKVNPARHLYERVGFAVTGETDTHCLMRYPAAVVRTP
jgi:GNAT superfamily N-acetyltransferase